MPGQLRPSASLYSLHASSAELISGAPGMYIAVSSIATLPTVGLAELGRESEDLARRMDLWKIPALG